MEIVDELRSSGTKVAVLTNGTDTIPEELRAMARKYAVAPGGTAAGGG